MRVGIVGGTGREGKGLALRLARAGHHILLGSRDPERALVRAAELRDLLPAGAGAIEGGGNAWACGADVVWLCVPYGAHAQTLTELRPRLGGRILIDITVPLRPPAVHKVALPAGRAAALEAQELLGADTRVFATLHHLSSTHLGDPEHVIDSDVLVCGDDDAARPVVLGLVGDLGVRALDAGPLENAIALESLTPVLIHLTKRHKSAGAGIRITGIG